ncbi:O-antigen ligase family protein [Weeksella virosa]|uniref:O-antigen ligase family protein n=1 Tax=Weeksella virosa TaxID=1014 RepID=UPI0015F049CC|nr:O-antigen ligase family protein [Weeksella virosa]
MNTFIFSLIGIIVFGTYNQVSYFLTSDNYNMATGSRVNDILILERPYLGFLCVIGILLSFHLYQKTKTKFYLFTTALFVIYPFVISARMSILSLILILIIYLFFNNKISFRTKAITTVGSAAIIILLFVLNPTLKSRLKVDSINVNDIETVKNADPRVIIWSCSYSIFTSDAYNLWIGINSKQKLEDQLVDCYKQDKTNLDRRDYFVSEKFNTHNQFIDLLLLNGFVGLILFLIMLYYVLKTSENTAIYLSLALLFFMFVENILARQMGIYLFALVIVFVFVLSNIYPKRESLSAT